MKYDKTKNTGERKHKPQIDDPFIVVVAPHMYEQTKKIFESKESGE